MSTLAFKSDVLEALGAVATSERRVVPVDLAGPWAESLHTAGFDPRAATTWIVEGLFPYLSSEAQGNALKTIIELSAPGSHAVIERSVPLTDSPDLEEKLQSFSRQTGLPMSELLAKVNPPEPTTILENAGWATRSYSVSELSARYGRPLTLDDAVPEAMNSADGSAPDLTRGGFVTATFSV